MCIVYINKQQNSSDIEISPKESFCLIMVFTEFVREKSSVCHSDLSIVCNFCKHVRATLLKETFESFNVKRYYIH